MSEFYCLYLNEFKVVGTSVCNMSVNATQLDESGTGIMTVSKADFLQDDCLNKRYVNGQFIDEPLNQT